MTEINRSAFEEAVSSKSPLTVEQIELLFGPVNQDNKAVVWRFLSMSRQQQFSIWQVYCKTKDFAPDFRIEAVR